MTFYHTCQDCIHCFNCGTNNCSSYLPPHDLKYVAEGEYMIKKCTHCGHILDKRKIPTLWKKKEEKK